MIPDIGLDLDAARAWLTAPRDDDETNAQYAGVASDDWRPLDDGGAFLATAEQLVDDADRSGLFGSEVSVLLYITAGTDLIADGALVTATAPRASAGPRLRLSSGHLDHDDLQWDPASRGLDAAVGVLRSVAYHAQRLIDEARTHLG